jgi:hypothetical protein
VSSKRRHRLRADSKIATENIPVLPEWTRSQHDRPVSTLHLVPADIRERYRVKEWRNATGVLTTACPGEWQDVLDLLRRFRLLKSEIVVGGVTAR